MVECSSGADRKEAVGDSAAEPRSPNAVADEVREDQHASTEEKEQTLGVRQLAVAETDTFH